MHDYEYECRMLYCYVEDSNQAIFYSESLFFIDAISNRYFFQISEGKIIDLYIPSSPPIYYQIELTGE